MPTCTNCKSEITYLIAQDTGMKEFKYFKDGRYEDLKDFVSQSEANYICPKCYITIFWNEKDANKFLNQKEVKT